MYGNYNTGYGMSPYQQQLAQNRLNQMEHLRRLLQLRLEQEQHSTHLEQSAETMSMQTRFVAEGYIILMLQQILVCLLYLLVNCVRRGLISLQSLRRQCRCLIWEMTMDGLINGL